MKRNRHVVKKYLWAIISIMCIIIASGQVDIATAAKISDIKNLNLKRWQTSDNRVWLEWDRAQSDFTGYEVVLMDLTGKKLKTLKSSSNSLSFSLKAVKNKGFGYKVRTYKTKKEKTTFGAWSSKKVFIAQPQVKASRTDEGSIKVTWSRVSGASDYTVYRSTKSESEYQEILITEAKEFIDTDLELSETYYYYVVANEIKAGSKTYSSASPIEREVVCMGKTGKCQYVYIDNYREAYQEFMQKVYELMMGDDANALIQFERSEEAENFAEKMFGDHYVYFPEDNPSKTGTGAGVYKFRDGGYYFHYGEYTNGIRNGDGSSYGRWKRELIVSFEGKWKNDAPNGQGNLIRIGRLKDGDICVARYTGKMVNGLWDGDVQVELVTEISELNIENYEFDMSFCAKKGIPVDDLTSELKNMKIPDGSYAYAYGYVIQNELGYEIALWCPYGSTVGFCDFADRF